MSVVSRSTLKGYFNTGDRPTESNFADLIDSTLNLNDSNTGDIDLTGNVTASSLTLNKNIVSAANTDAAFYIIFCKCCTG